jgi:hypothetical protein
MTGDKLNNAIAVRYPDAPACPTDAYRKAAAKKAKLSVTVEKTSINAIGWGSFLEDYTLFTS